MAPLVPYIKECDTIYAHSYFTSGLKLSYKHSYFKKIRGQIVKKIYTSKYLHKILWSFNIYPFLAPKGPCIMEYDNISPCLYFTKGIKLSTKHKYFKKIRGWVDKKIYTSKYLQKIWGFFKELSLFGPFGTLCQGMWHYIPQLIFH